jgi:hypothetical protein
VGIEYADIKSILSALKHELPEGRGRLLILGDAHIHFSANQYISLAEDLGYELSSFPEVLDPFSLGKSLGFVSTDTLDINGKASITLDLQQRLPHDLLGKFDCLIDAGVLFWCFDPGVVLKNLYRLVKIDGVIAHITGVSGFYGRCYYNIHPLVLEDFYRCNQCRYISASYRAVPKRTSLAMRLKGLLGAKCTPGLVSYTSSPGNIYLDESRAGVISFCRTLRTPESDVIPNNAIGTLIFKKCSNVEPQSPLRS